MIVIGRRASAARAGIVALLAASGLALAGCRADRRDFAEQAQRFIVFDEDLAARTGVGFSAATCASPASTAPGTSFTCTGDASDGTTWAFTVTIGPEGTYTVAVTGSADTAAD